jgi:hypothetical protein
VDRLEAICLGKGGEKLGTCEFEWNSLPKTQLAVALEKRIAPRKPAHCILIGQGQEVLAVFFSRLVLPARAVSLNGKPFSSWVGFTSTARMGEYGGGRVYIGPNALLRQVDVRPSLAWSLMYLVLLREETGCQALHFGEDEVWGFRNGENQFYLLGDGAKWGVYGAGNSDPEKLVSIGDQFSGEDGSAFLYQVGAMRLDGQR